MFFQIIIYLLTLALAPLSMAAVCHKKPHGIEHKHADVASADGIPVPNDPQVKAACSRGRKHHGKKTKHAKVPSSIDDISAPYYPPVEGAPGKEEPGKEEPGKEEPGKEEPGKEEPGKEEPGKEPGKGAPGYGEPGKEEPGKEPGKDAPIKSHPGDGHYKVAPGYKEPGKDEPIKGEPGDGHYKVAPGYEEPGKEPGKGEPIKGEPGDGHYKAPVSGPEFIGLGTMYRGDKYRGDDKDNCHEEDCWQKGACSFTDYKLPAGIDGSTCISEALWENGAHCGGCVTVTHEGKTLTLMVTNRTDGRGNNMYHLDMTPDTMTKLVGAPKGGIGNVKWAWTACPIPENMPLAIKMHGGSSQYWLAVTVENATLRTAKVEVSADKGQHWKATKREMFNMYVVERLPTNNVWVRVTSVTGKQVVVKDVQIESGKSVPASANY